MGAEEGAFLEAGRKTLRPLAQKGGSSASGAGGPTNDLGGRVVTETKGNEPMKGPDEPDGPARPPGEVSGIEGEEGRPSKGLTAPMKVSKEEREEHVRTHTP